jgi:hypothetical protein
MAGACSAYRRRGIHRVLLGKLRESDHLEEPDVDGMILRSIFRKWDVGVRIGSIWLRIGTGGGHM